MNKTIAWFTSRVVLIIFAYILIFFSFKGLTSNYYEGDSLNYHIPIAKAIVFGTVGSPDLINGVPFLKYSPGSSEGILAGLIVFKIPINIYNVFGLIALFFACLFIGRRFLLNKDSSIVFAGSIVTLHTMLRWINTQVIDVWLAVWFVLVLALLEKPEKTLRYFAFLGIFCGMLIGSKYSGPLFLFVLFVFYFKKLWRYLDLRRIITFLIPLSILGLSWYFRNYIHTGNPMYPQGFLMFKDGGLGILKINVWRATFLYLNGINHFINAIISEYGLFALSIFAPLLLLSRKVRKFKYVNLILIGSISLVIFFFLPSDKHYNIAVSVFRYSYPAFITLILALFLLAKQFKKENVIILFALSNFLIIPELIFKPKLAFLLLPIVFLVFYEEEVLKYFRSKVLVVNKKRT